MFKAGKHFCEVLPIETIPENPEVKGYTII